MEFILRPWTMEDVDSVYLYANNEKMCIRDRDNPDRLKESLEQAFQRNDIVVMTGGLGPTYDDLTKETVAQLFGKKMILHQESLERIERFFKYYNRVMTENNRKQAYMPEPRHLQGKACSQSGLLCHLHTIGAAAARQAPDAE